MPRSGAVVAALLLCLAVFWIADGLVQFIEAGARDGPGALGAWLTTGVPMPRAVFRLLAPLALLGAGMGLAALWRPREAARGEAGFIHHHLREAIETVPVAFALYDADDRLVISNRLYRSLCVSSALYQRGVSFETLVRATAHSGYMAEARGREEEWIARRMAQHRDPRGAIEQKTDRGHRLVIEHRTEDGYTLLVIQDISALRKAESDLLDALRQARSANESKTAFLANMSHELRTPLNCVIGFSDIIADEMMGPIGHPKYKEYASDIRQAGRDLLDIINDILDLSRIEAGRITLSERVFDIGELLAHCVRVIAPRALELGLTLRLECPPDPPSIRADEHRVRQILFNLLSNAVMFTMADGTITVRVAGTPEGGLSVAVADTGIGMSRDEIARVTSLFVPDHDPLLRRRRGAGLGLPLCHGLMALHDGSMAIESELGKGTTVTLVFPPSRIVASDAGPG